MKILYSANNYSGANIYLSEFLKRISGHDIKVMAYYKNHELLHHIDWVTDAIISEYRINKIIKMFQENKIVGALSVLYGDILDWKPDLIISDAEPVSAFLASILNIELWYCSPLLLLTGIEWKIPKPILLRKTIEDIKHLPKANRYLINSPFCDVVNCPFLLDNFEWIKTYPVKPKSVYKNLPRDVLVTTGESSYLAYYIYNNENVFIISNDDEQILNSALADYYKLGFGIGNNLEIIDSVINRAEFNKNFLEVQSWPYLEDLINGKNNCI